MNVFFLLVSLLVVGCSGSHISSNPDIKSVNPNSVQTIVVTKNPTALKACQKELEKKGAHILYQSRFGALLLDKALDPASLSDCDAAVSPNLKVMLNLPSAGGLKDLPTLLRLLPAEETGARSFIKAHPEYDGRHTRIAILDTGIELDHPILQKTLTGENKIIDFEDFSGEGRVELKPVGVKDSTFAINGQTFNLTGITGTDYRFGIFHGTSLKSNDAINKKDDFADVGVITYLDAKGKRVGRIDVDNNLNFGNEVELTNYFDSRKFTKMGRHQNLTVALNISPDSSSANLVFDDGGHGTHVAGIAAGYSADGLQGVAPGAQIIAVKIGDNRLAGGSTTTASMVLAIDYAVQSGADIINLSYGVRAGSNLGQSVIDQYIDKVAAQYGTLFSIAAGNEGPGLLTVGTPGGASLAISSGAYLSKQTANENFGYSGVENNGLWYFSSVGPRLDGGWKPSLVSPGSALSSTPVWDGFAQNFSGTSMATPETTGGLALLLSAARQRGLPIDRVAITRAVYNSAVPLSGYSLIEQGHGLLNIPAAYANLAQQGPRSAVEYQVETNSLYTADGKGAGIYIRSETWPTNGFTVSVTPHFALDVSPEEQNQIKTYRLEASHPWIKTVSSFYLTSDKRAFEINLDASAFTLGGLYSGKISAIEESTGQVAFDVPVTVIMGDQFTSQNRHQVQKSASIRPGDVKRYFLNVEAGITALQISMTSDGPFVWAQLLDAEGRLLLTLKDTDTSLPMSPQNGAIRLTAPGVYELDVVAPVANSGRAQVQLSTKAYSLQVAIGSLLAPQTYEFNVRNGFEAVKLTPSFLALTHEKHYDLQIDGNKTIYPFDINGDDLKQYSEIEFEVKTAKKFYDLMTDYPFRVFDISGNVVNSGGLELDSKILLSDLEPLTRGTNTLEIQGAFADKAPSTWLVEVIERRRLANPETLYQGKGLLFEAGQTVTLPLNLSNLGTKSKADFDTCASLEFEDVNGKFVQDFPVCSNRLP